MILLMTVCGELGLNYPSLMEGYGEIDISSSIEIQENGTEKCITAEYQFPEPVFIRQVKLEGTFSEGTYTIDAATVNEFDKEETYSATDTVHALFPEFYTNLNRRVKSIRITLPCGSDSWQLERVSVSNQAELNKYRMVFMAVVLFLLYCIFFEPFFRKRAEYFFLLFALGFGCVLLLSGQPQCNAWDEEIHFQNAYLLAGGKAAKWNEAAEWMSSGKTVKCNTKAEYALLRKVMDEKGGTAVLTKPQGGSGILRGFFGYLPGALFLKAGLVLGLPFSWLVLLGRMGNLLAYCLVMFWAVRLAGRKKWFLTFLALMPTPLFLACSYTYDSVVFSFITLGAVLWEREMETGEKDRKKAPMLVSLFLILAGSMVKVVYLPVLLIWMMSRQIWRLEKKERRKIWIAGAVICAAAAAVLFWYWLLPILNGSRLVGDARGGETDMGRQLLSMMSHPWASVRMMIRDIFSLDNFRNSGIESYNNFFAGNLMFLNYYLLGVMGDRWCIVLLPMLTLLLLYPGEERDVGELLNKKQQIFLTLVLTASVLLIWLSMYLVFTPVGDGKIAGVQARYYLPLAYLAALIPQNRRICVRGRAGEIAMAAMLAALLLEAVSLYGFLLKGRLL